MDFKTFLIKKVVMGFCISITCITAAMALIGVVFAPDVRFGYDAFLSPLLFGFMASLPGLVKYSRKELSPKQVLVRDIVHVVLLEAVVLSTLFLAGLLTSSAMVISLGCAILVIYATVKLVLWLQDKNTAKEFNADLLKLQANSCQDR